MKIRTKLLGSYIILLAVGFLLSAISFHYILRIYTVNQTRQEIKKEAQLVADAIASQPLESPQLGSRVQALRRLRLAGQLLETYVVILDKNNKPIYSNTTLDIREKILLALNRRVGAASFIIEQVPVTVSGVDRGTVLLAARAEDIQQLNPRFLYSELLSFLIAGLIAFIIASIFSQQLSEAIDRLRKNMLDFSVRKPYQAVSIDTGDEIQDLSRCFDDLAMRLKDYDERQKTFLQNSSHELKTPLMSIQGYAEAIREGVVQGAELNQSLDIIIEESQRLKKTVDEIIYLSKLENPDNAFVFTPHSLGEILGDVRRRLQVVADNKGVTLDMDDRLEQVWNLDEEKFRQLLTNVVDNCIRYAKSQVSIKHAITAEQLVLTITDDGPGFSPGEERKVFDRFYKGSHGGSGIGLAIAQAVVEGHGGSIRACNAPSGGAQFFITLPPRQSSV